ncbi:MULTISPECIES: ATP-binding protein [unclassified Pseudomonas]|uniref:ATP-binding protein n=1 Tax=unclassified Pseudomonas TaxID=196821 RepID=UPI000CD27710|nr:MULTISPECIES: ATP-binding protein [unclassified Pseudomonas]POA28514.1 ATP-binding protein [Pseudomonas sp. GW456-R21]POA71556.1 ATP-binding protein [Pseudomonas sp. GW460-R15]
MEHSHPILSREYRLNTPTLLAVVQNACFKVLMRKTGVVYTGEPRVGKTVCCEALLEEIPKRFPNVYVVMIPAINKDADSPRYSSIVHQLIDQEGILPKARTTFVQRQSMLLERLKTRAELRNAKQIVLLIDELSRLSIADYKQLADIYNKLRADKITMTVISFAMPSIEMVVADFLRNDDRHIIGRFLSDIRPLYGVTTIAQLNEVLKLYDDCAEEKLCGYSFTRNVLPQAYAAGFRLTSIAADVWREMSRFAAGKYVNNLPMEHVALVIAYLFLILSDEDSGALSVPQDLIEEAVRESNFKEFCKNVTDVKT